MRTFSNNALIRFSTCLHPLGRVGLGRPDEELPPGLVLVEDLAEDEVEDLPERLVRAHRLVAVDVVVASLEGSEEGIPCGDPQWPSRPRLQVREGLVWSREIGQFRVDRLARAWLERPHAKCQIRPVRPDTEHLGAVLREIAQHFFQTLDRLAVGLVPGFATSPRG